jgi:hypothetical protein
VPVDGGLRDTGSPGYLVGANAAKSGFGQQLRGRGQHGLFRFFNPLIGFFGVYQAFGLLLHVSA